MFSGTNPVGQPTGATTQYQTTQPGWNPPPPTTSATQGTYGQDQYGSTQGSTQGYPINLISNDYRRPVDYNAMRLQTRLSGMGISNTAELLSRCSTPGKRSFLITTIAAFDSQLTSDQVRQYLNNWIGMADLCRTGMQIDTARLLQTSGIYDAPSLSRYFAPMDKLALYGTMTQNAMQFGYRLPNFQEFSAQVDAARTLPMAIRW
jgi:hypothetical protein